MPTRRSIRCDGSALRARGPGRHDGRRRHGARRRPLSTSTHGRIVAGAPAAGAGAPDGFADAPVVRTGGTIYPGLIELHNHLSYNVLPLWHVAGHVRATAASGPGAADYRVAVTGPMRVLGRTTGYVEAVVRYVEAKCLRRRRHHVAGHHARVEHRHPPLLPRRRPQRRGQPDDAELPERRHPDRRRRRPATPTAFLERLEGGQRLLLHLSEGIDDDRPRATSRRCGSRRAGGRSRRAAPASTAPALHGRDFRASARRGGTHGVVAAQQPAALRRAPPTSRAAEAAGVPIALGSDWSPSGSKNLLGELKVAASSTSDLPGAFTARELVAMVTDQPGRILKWDGVPGSLEAGKRADLIVVDGRQGDPYEQLLRGEGDVADARDDQRRRPLRHAVGDGAPGRHHGDDHPR